MAWRRTQPNRKVTTGSPQAPDELESRVDRSLRKRASLVSMTPRMRLVRRAAMATAALFAACVGAFVWIREANQEPAPRYRFEVRRVTNLASMDPMAQSLVSGLSGGLLLPGQPKSDDPK